MDQVSVSSQRRYEPRSQPTFGTMMRLLGYLLLADGAPVPESELLALLREMVPSGVVHLTQMLDRLHLVGCNIRRARGSVRLTSLPPDDLLEDVLASVDELKLIGRLPSCGIHWYWRWADDWPGRAGRPTESLALPNARHQATPGSHSHRTERVGTRVGY